MSNGNREFEFRYTKWLIVPFLLFGAIWAPVAYGADAVFSSSIAMHVIFISIPIIWFSVHMLFEKKGKAIMYSDRVEIKLADAEHTIFYRNIRQVWASAGNMSVWCIVLKDKTEVRILASLTIKPWRKSLWRFMRALNKEVEGLRK